ncbi:unnamed protein product [Microthlaspi erraticum]|uniref:Uncharacterized protein n=1 Tax=Microthlaspi erraticum TaxID=1685480 RepID=A0A6D2HQW7_9BRAS|nr:unnamed protein product [Microthlaspi erraticum]
MAPKKFNPSLEYLIDAQRIRSSFCGHRYRPSVRQRRILKTMEASKVPVMACQDVANLVKTSLGPVGFDKVYTLIQLLCDYFEMNAEFL